MTFAMPPYYSDNPAWPAPNPPYRDIRILECGSSLPLLSGSSLPIDTLAATAAVPTLLRLPAQACAFDYAVDLDSAAPGRWGLAYPDLAPGLQLVDGATLFALPWLAEQADPAASWRTPMAIEVEWEPSPGIQSIGLPRRDELASPYELMFVRGVLGRPRTLSFQVNLQGGPTRIALFATTSDTVDLGPLADSLPKYLKAVESLLGPLPTDYLAIGEVKYQGGLEGLHGYWFGTPYVGYSEVHLHELIHLWVGVRWGDVDMPWFKEGVTTYLADWLMVSGGWQNSQIWEAVTELTARDTSGPLATTPLAGLEARSRYFRPLNSQFRDGNDSGWYALVYGKGPQVALLMDVWMLETSRGRYGLADALRRLHQKNRPGFTRADFYRACETLAGADPGEIFDPLMDGVGPIPVESIRDAFGSLHLWREF